MSKLAKIFAALALIAGASVITPDIAAAQHHHGGHHGGGGGWCGGGWGPGFGFGWGNPYLLRRTLLLRGRLRLGAGARLAPRPLGLAPRLAVLVTRKSFRRDGTRRREQS